MDTLLHSGGEESLVGEECSGYEFIIRALVRDTSIEIQRRSLELHPPFARTASRIPQLSKTTEVAFGNYPHEKFRRTLGILPVLSYECTDHASIRNGGPKTTLEDCWRLRRWLIQQLSQDKVDKRPQILFGINRDMQGSVRADSLPPELTLPGWQVARVRACVLRKMARMAGQSRTQR